MPFPCQVLVIALLLSACSSNTQSVKFRGQVDVIGEAPAKTSNKRVTVHCVGYGADEQCVTITHDPINRTLDPTPR